VFTKSLYKLQVNLRLSRVTQKRVNTSNSNVTVRTLSGSRLLTDGRWYADLSLRSAPINWDCSLLRHPNIS